LDSIKNVWDGTLRRVTLKSYAIDTSYQHSPGASDCGGRQFDNSYTRLPQRFYARLQPTPVRSARIVKFNYTLAEELGLEAKRLESDVGAAFFSGNQLPDGAEPLAMAYAGHQFGHFVP
jgi:uncharacterized protein YdiU (UPF0061 family)